MISGTDTSTFFLRQATDLDGPAVRELVFGVLEEYGLKPDPDGMDADLEALQTEYQGPGGVFEVLETPDGKIIGCYGLFVIDEKYCELRKMYLRPDARGKGIGKALLTRALNMAKKLEFSELRLETASCLVEAIRLYRSFGFEPLPGKQEAERCDMVFGYNLAQWNEQELFTNKIPALRMREK